MHELLTTEADKLLQIILALYEYKVVFFYMDIVVSLQICPKKEMFIKIVSIYISKKSIRFYKNLLIIEQPNTKRKHIHFKELANNFFSEVDETTQMKLKLS